MNEAYIIPFFVYGTLTFSLLLLGIVFMIVLQRKRQYLYQAEKKEREYQYKKESLNAQIELQEQLLNNISREIHDNVGQVLSLVKVHLFSVSTHLTDEKTINLIETSSELLDKAIEDLRGISHTQNGSHVQQLGLKDAIRKELDYIAGLKKQECTMQLFGDHYSIPAEQELLIYRIAQEAIHNSIKHAKCSELKVSLNYEPKFFSLTITDNGQGFNTSDESKSNGIGISHMRHRAKVLLAELDISSKLSNGTAVTLKMPITSL